MEKQQQPDKLRQLHEWLQIRVAYAICIVIYWSLFMEIIK